MSKRCELFIEGMKCASCEFLIEKKLKEVPGIRKARVNFGSKKAFIKSEDSVNIEHLNAALAPDGYRLSREPSRAHGRKNSKRDYLEIAASALVVFGLYLVLKETNLFDFNFSVSENMGYGLIFLVGLVAASSSCIAVTGGVLLGVTARYNEAYGASTPLAKAAPHFFFNLGRIVSYTLLGGVIGWIGSALTVTPFMTGVITLTAAFFMIIMGMRMLNIFPWFTRISLPMPRFLSERVAKLETKKGRLVPFLAGASTFFLPCGFTQAFQLYAVSTGSFAAGALTLGVFSLGTLPALLSLSLISSFSRGGLARLFLKFSGVLVLVFGFYNISNGLALAGSPIDFASVLKAPSNISEEPAEAVMKGNVQVVSMTVDRRGYTPDSFIVKKGLPVRWEIDGEEVYGCQSVIIMPKYRITKFIEPGSNVIAFLPEEEGTVPFSCSMGMYRGTFIVI